MTDPNKNDDSPFDDKPTGGRYLLAALFFIALFLLAIIKTQTTAGSAAQTAVSGGWWAEPALAPAVALLITIAASILGYLAARRESFDFGDTLRVYTRILLIASCMILSVLLMKVVGFALSFLLFSATAAYIAKFRGVKLVLIALGCTLAMVLIFRVGFSIWFPRPLLFNWINLPTALHGIL